MKQLFSYALLILTLILSTLSAQAQNWWNNYPSTNCSQFIPTSDSSYLIFGVKSDSMQESCSIIKIDENGKVLSNIRHSFGRNRDKLFRLSTGKLVLISPPPIGPPVPVNIFLLAYRLDSIGRLEKIDTISAIDRYIGYPTMLNDSVFVCSNSYTSIRYTSELLFFNINQKNIVQRISQGLKSTLSIHTVNKGLVYFTSEGTDTLTRVLLDSNNQVVNRVLLKRHGYIATDKDDNSYFSNYSLTLDDIKIVKLDKLGNKIWERKLLNELYPHAATFLPNGDIIFVLRKSVYNPSINRSLGFTYLLKCNRQGDSLWLRELLPLSEKLLDIISIVPTKNHSFLMAMQGTVNFTPTQKYIGAQVIKIDADGQFNISFQNSIKGNVYQEVDNNCLFNPNEIVMKSHQIEAIRGNSQVYRALTDRFGNYNILCDTGTYVVKNVSLNDLWQTCTPSVSRRISTVGATEIVDFPLNPLVNCALLTIDMSTNGLIRCFDRPIFVNYCNKGTIPATNAYIEIRLDSLIEFKNATRPVSTQNRNIFRFNLGTIGVGDCGQFNIIGRVRCGDSTRLGQTLCNEARIYPDSSCLPIGTFSGANLTVLGNCVGDSVQFIVKNVGTATSRNTPIEIISNDNLVLRTTINGLAQNAIFSLKYRANGNTWRMSVEQEPNHPQSLLPTAFVEGCGINSNGTNPINFATMFGNDDASPSVSTLCRPIIGSFDPNDKQGFPTGYKSDHFIRQNQDLEYMIRFQNTGTDTAFTVVIRDTLTDVLDISSIEFGGSSHPYTTDIYGSNILKFTFNNINLPDSFRGEVASHGFVKFRIKQKKNLNIGTKIENKAGIYFDFNDPVITNKTVHTIAKDVLITAIIEPNNLSNSLTINVSPNPFTEHATFELLELNKPFNSDFNLDFNSIKFQLFDGLGRLLRNEKITNYRFDFDRKELVSGLYFFKIMDNGKLIGQGKLMMQ
jgi:uncharacterized repeat protein (TIGR01451 family)